MTWFTQEDIVELFDEASDRSRYKLAFEERAHTPARFPFPKAEPALTDEDVLRIPIPHIPRWVPLEKKTKRKSAPRRKVPQILASERRPPPSACQRCGASAPNHRCATEPTTKQLLVEAFKNPERVKRQYHMRAPRYDSCQKCGARSSSHRCPG